MGKPLPAIDIFSSLIGPAAVSAGERRKMIIPESMNAEFVIERIVNRYAICADYAAEAYAKADVEEDMNQKNIWQKCGELHESRADVLFDLLKVIAGSEEIAADWVNENDC